MIIKILSSALNFSGVNYNERKNDLGESELLRAENFGGLSYQTDLTRADYLNYMKAIGSLNPRVKNKQFHAVISVKGKSDSLNKLVDAGIQYLDKMGYGKNPYLIYHHADTPNTHIHLVSTRIDKNGHKVDDSFEKLRSQKVMHAILARDPVYEADAAISNVMKYTFSTEAQFKLLMELQGFKVRETEGSLTENGAEWEIIKYGLVQRNLDSSTVHARIDAYKFAAQRARQLNTIFLKYSIGLNEDQWVNLMKDKFGIVLVFHRKHVDDKPYGYTIVDHPQKNVFKGSQVLRLSELYAAASEVKLTGLVKDLAKKPGLSFKELQLELANLGLSLNQKGTIPIHSGMVHLPFEVQRKLKYADRLSLASSFKINDPTSRAILGKLMMINPSDISAAASSDKDFEAIQAVVAYLEQQNKWEQGLHHFNYTLIRHNNAVFLLSAADPALIRLDKLVEHPLATGMADIPELKDILEQLKLDNQLQHASRENVLAILLDMIAESQQKPQDHKKKKRMYKSLKP